MIRVYETLEQGSDEWLAARCGMITASEVKHIITPSLKPANNDKTRAHLYDLLAQRITRHVEPLYLSDDMLRGKVDEIDARNLYARQFAPVHEVGFITNDKWGFMLGYSPDGLVGDDGAIECKSRRPKYQVQTIVDGVLPDEYLMQIQTGLLVSERAWIDFISFSAGLPMFTLRCWPDEVVQDAIIEAVGEFEAALEKRRVIYTDNAKRLVQTERRVEQEMFL